MKTKKLLIGVAAVAIVAGLLVKAGSRRRRKASKRLVAIADEGYETAHDILFPKKSKETSKLKYGPVLPN